MKRVAWFVGLLVIFGCGGSSVNNSTVAPDPLVGFINASPNSNALDVLVNDDQIGNDVKYLGLSPAAAGVLNFRSFEPGDYDVSVQENADPETQALEVFTMNRDKSYVVFACGLVARFDDPDAELDKLMRPVFFEFDRTKPNGNKARIIIVHGYNRGFGLETPAIDFRNPGDNPAVNEQNITFASARQILIDAGSQTFVARPNESEFEITPQTTFDFQGGKIYAAIVSGVEDEVGTKAPKISFIEIQSK